MEISSERDWLDASSSSYDQERVIRILNPLKALIDRDVDVPYYATYDATYGLTAEYHHSVIYPEEVSLGVWINACDPDEEDNVMCVDWFYRLESPDFKVEMYSCKEVSGGLLEGSEFLDLVEGEEQVIKWLNAPPERVVDPVDDEVSVYNRKGNRLYVGNKPVGAEDGIDVILGDDITDNDLQTLAQHALIFEVKLGLEFSKKGFKTVTITQNGIGGITVTPS